MSNKDRFIDNGDGTISDLDNKLMWTKTDSMIDQKKWINYIEGQDYIRELREGKFAGYDDWRMPTFDQLKTIYDDSFLNKDLYNNNIHISEKFSSGCGFSIIAQQVSGRAWTHIIDLKNGEIKNSESLWTFSEATRGVRVISKEDN